MIHVVIGGSMSGKTTFVRNHFLRAGVGGITEDRIGRVPVSISDFACAIGHYNRQIRTCGVDQMGRDYPKIRRLLLDFLDNNANRYREIAMEGNALADGMFMDVAQAFKLKLWLMMPTAAAVSLRYKKLGLNYGRSIVTMSYKRAFRTFNTYKARFPHEIVST